MVQQYDPTITIHESIDTEDDRVEFIVGAVKAMHNRAGIQLDAKSLYAADSRAVGELAKVASILYRAVRMSQEEDDATSTYDQYTRNEFFAVDQQDVERAKALVQDIAESGARLSKLLQQQDAYGETRSQALRFLDTALGSLRHDAKEQQDDVESALKQSLDAIQSDADATETRIKDMTRKGKDLTAKITKRTQDLKRSEEHLAELKDVRPAYMDEYEILEEELKELHQTHTTRAKTIQYLDHELGKVETREAEVAKRAEEARLKLQRQIEAEEEALRMVHDDDSTSGGSEDDDSLPSNSGRSTPSTVPSGGNRATSASNGVRAGNAALESPDGTGTSISSEGAPLSDDGSSFGSSDSDDSAW